MTIQITPIPSGEIVNFSIKITALRMLLKGPLVLVFFKIPVFTTRAIQKKCAHPEPLVNYVLKTNI
jgi:hypothetical protein